MNSHSIIKSAETEAKAFFVGTGGCHDRSRVERVRTTALVIGREEGADFFKEF